MRRFTLLLLLPSLAGCAGGMEGVKPVLKVDIREPSGLEIEPEGNGREIQIRVPFEGGSETCGMQKDSFYLDVGAVHCTSNPASAIAELLVAELRKAGFNVQVGATPTKPSTVQIEGELLLFFTEPVGKSGNETDVHLRLAARSDSGLDAERTFYEKGRGGDAHRSVNSGVRRILQASVDAIVQLMNDYPMLGVTPSSVAKKLPNAGQAP